MYLRTEPREMYHCSRFGLLTLFSIRWCNLPRQMSLRISRQRFWQRLLSHQGLHMFQDQAYAHKDVVTVTPHSFSE